MRHARRLIDSLSRWIARGIAASWTISLILTVTACAGPEVSPGDPDADPTVIATGPWGAPDMIVPLARGATREHDAILSDDRLELYFACMGCPGSLGGEDIHQSTRASADDEWSPPVVVTALSSADDEVSPRLTADELTMYFSSTRPGGPGDMDVWVSTRTDRRAAWTTPTPATSLNSEQADRTATPCAGGERFVLESTRLDGEGQDLYEAVGDQVTPIAEVNSTSDDLAPFITEDCLTLYFASERVLTYDLFVARRPSVDEPFGAPERIDELSDESPDASGDQFDPWVSADEGHIVFTRDVFDPDLVEAFR